MFEKIMTWIKGASDFMSAAINGGGTELVQMILGIIREVQATGKSGADKRALAFTLLVSKLPEIIELAVKLMKSEEAVYADCPDGKCPKTDSVQPVSGCVLPGGEIDWNCDGK